MILFPRLSKHPFLSENIYNWVESEDNAEDQGKPLYQSQYHIEVKNFYKSVKSSVPRTMGYAKTPLREPHNYLKKHTNEERYVDKGSKSVPCLCRESRKVPQVNDYRKSLPKKKKETERNFVLENLKDVLKRPATVPNPRLTDDRRGHSIPLEESGLVPKYVQKEDFGRKPKYIDDIKRNLQKSRKHFEKFVLDGQIETAPQKISEETKEELFKGLVRNWKELLHMYHVLPMETKTPFQVKRRLDIERRIDALEQDIEFLLRNKDIFLGRH